MSVNSCIARFLTARKCDSMRNARRRQLGKFRGRSEYRIRRDGRHCYGVNVDLGELLI
jgi:hypothetical protein